MPHVTVKCYKGRTEEQLKEAAEKIAQATAEAFKVDISAVSVAVEEVAKEDWGYVYNNEIKGGNTKLLVEPGY